MPKSSHHKKRHARPGKRQRSIRTRRLLKWLFILALAVTLAILDRNGLLLASRPDADQYNLANAMVSRVVDGDTIVVDLPDPLLHTATTRVRLWGIDCPEMARSSPAQRPAQPFAQQAADFVNERALNRTVTLRIERHRVRDKYDRILAHVMLPDGTSLAEQLLLAGLTRADDRWSHTYLQRYEQLEYTARKNHAGMWK